MSKPFPKVETRKALVEALPEKLAEEKKKK